ncbi:RNA polymerase factor sigma-54 [Halomonas garicola]|uniref:RNA polymerase factor sigma-54 n=1 Tax=Halomonas garicola TaxID=1690008 RepID=UPI002899AEE6|nr:RNA polymerase factor sigma-54 [Halomonas garicola]
MAMKASLQLRVGTQLTMTPQLRQAIGLLQLPTLDLRQEIQQAVEANPLLEQEDEFGEQAAVEPAEDSWAEQIPGELAVDSDWSDTYPDTQQTTGEGPDFERQAAGQTLHGHLLWQLAMLDLTPGARLTGEALIDSVDANGYLTQPLEDIGEGLKGHGGEPISADCLERMLGRLQQFDPTGVFARDLGECLTLQLDAMPGTTPQLMPARRLARQFLTALGQGDTRLLKRRLGLDDAGLDAVTKLIKSLDPRPGSAFDSAGSGHVLPDLLARRSEGGWQLELNPDALPQLRIQPDYAALIQKADSSRDNSFLKEHLQEARWLIKSLASRNDTLLRVGREILARQLDFLDHGEAAMKPLVLADIAEAVGMHESTISRVTTQKFLHTPRGVFELKYFFSSQLAGDDDSTHSSTAIRARIKQLIEQEPPAKPLSDSRLAALLDEAGIRVARRTVAKYREALGIPPTSERRRRG